VVLFPFEALGFELGTEKPRVPGDAIMEQPVQIVTLFAPGPRSMKSAPPRCDLNLQVHNSKLISAKNPVV